MFASYGNTVVALGAAASTGKSQNGWPASSSPTAIGVQTYSLALRNGTKSLQIAAAASEPLLEMIRWWDANVEPVETVYGYNYREIRGYEGTGTISNHGSGTAIDINASKHPLGARGTVSTTTAARIVAKAASLGLRWGGTYRSRADEMHFEVVLPPTAEAVRAVAVKRAIPIAFTAWIAAGLVGLTLITLWARRRRRASEAA